MGRDKQPVDTLRRAGRSLVREEDVQERNSQDGYDPDDDDSLRKGIAEILLGEVGSSASEGGEDKERRSGEDEKRCGRGGNGGGLKRKSGWLDKEAAEGSSSNRNRRRKLSKKDLPPLPNPPPDMPREFKDKIKGLGGKDVTLILHWCRLSFPKSQFTGTGFLREGERRKLDEREEILVRVIFPNLPEKNLIFTALGKHKKSESNTKKAEPMSRGW